MSSLSFTPRHAQPFTLDEAIRLDVPTITAEIARLQHSLQHLHSSQEELQAYLAENTPPDPDLQAAVDENVTAIEAQEERIAILRRAMEQKGAAVASNPHYDISAVSINGLPVPRADINGGNEPGDRVSDGDEDGVFL